jgi:acetolactate synthase I/II/III large subunit
MTNSAISAAQRLLTLAASLGVDYVFTNLGSDHPAFIEAFATLKERGLPMPKVVSCPHESTALSAAHGYAMVVRRPQIVLIHVDVGTQNLGGAVHNAFRARVPAIVIAGLSPVTMGGSSEKPGRVGGRNEFIHFLQDAPRQHEIVQQYMKWCYELRAPEMAENVLMRAFQIASSAPQGPVYVTGAREVWEGFEQTGNAVIEQWPAARLAGLPDEDAEFLRQALLDAHRPLLITSSLGRHPEAVSHLVALSEKIGLGVCEVSPQYMSFPGTHAHHLGYRRNSVVDEADLILLMDVDVPWIPSKVKLASDARVFIVDQDALKQSLGFWHYPAERCWQADSSHVLRQLLEQFADSPPASRERRAWLAQMKSRFNSPTRASQSNGPINAEELFWAVRELMNERSVVLMEAPTSTELIPSILQPERPGSYFSSGGSSLGWGINAAIGVKMARADTEVIAIVGDGSYVFGVPSSAYWVARAYGTPQLTIICNNGGWAAPRLSTLAVHPEGAAQRNDTYWVTMSEGAKLARIAAAAGDAAAFEVTEREDLAAVLQEAIRTVRTGRSAVVDVTLAPISAQTLG